MIGLDGSLGTGKTTFTKGIGTFLQIPETLTSPTYTYLQQYEWTRSGVQGELDHLDLWQINTQEELDRLEIAALLKPKHLVVIEWFDQVKQWLEPLLLQHQLPFLRVVLTETSPHSRQITILEPST